MPILDDIVERALSWVGLGFELSLDGEEPAFHKVADALFVGRLPRPEDVEALKDAGITDIASCLPANLREGVGFLEEDFRTHFFELRDSIHQDLGPSFPRFCGLVSEVRAQSGQVLVHCEAGVSRSASLAIAAVMQAEDLGFYEAYVRVRDHRPGVLPNIGFASQLYALERKSTVKPSSLARYLVEICRVPAEVELLQASLEQHGFDAGPAILSIFGGEMPRVVQGVRL